VVDDSRLITNYKLLFFGPPEYNTLMTSEQVIAVDLGGTSFRVALCNRDGQIVKRVKHPTLAPEGPESVISRMVAAIQGVIPSDGVAALAVAAPGPLDPFTGVVMYAPNLPGWYDVPLRQILKDRLGVPAAIANDANMAALGEQRYGAARGIRDMAYVTLSTGIGCGVILNNQLVLGLRGLATELGHICIDINAPPGNSGVPGGFESLAAGPAIARLAQQKLRECGGLRSRMLELAGGDIAAVSAKEVGEAAHLGDPLALEIVHYIARVIGLGFVNLFHLFDPAIVVAGGSVSLMGDILFEPIRATVQQYVMEPYRGRPIVRAQLGDDSGLYGAAALAFDIAA
jgi:glucokinase